MKVRILLITMLVFTGCGKPEVKQARPKETNDVDKVYAKGVVILKTGEKLTAHILLQCPGYLTVCFKINSSEPGSSQLVRWEDVQTVLLEKSLSEVDPMWKLLQKEMTVLTEQGESLDRR
jgi:hypothetical protein